MAINIPGDLLTSGDILNPLLSAVLLDSGSINSGASNFCYFNITYTLQTSVAGTFVLGIYNSDDSADSVFKITVIANDSKILSLQRIPVQNNQKLKILSGLAIIGTVNVSMNLISVGQD